MLFFFNTIYFLSKVLGSDKNTKEKNLIQLESSNEHEDEMVQKSEQINKSDEEYEIVDHDLKSKKNKDANKETNKDENKEILSIPNTDSENESLLSSSPIQLDIPFTFQSRSENDNSLSHSPVAQDKPSPSTSDNAISSSSMTRKDATPKTLHSRRSSPNRGIGEMLRESGFDLSRKSPEQITNKNDNIFPDKDLEKQKLLSHKPTELPVSPGSSLYDQSVTGSEYNSRNRNTLDPESDQHIRNSLSKTEILVQNGEGKSKNLSDTRKKKLQKLSNLNLEDKSEDFLGAFKKISQHGDEKSSPLSDMNKSKLQKQSNIDLGDERNELPGPTLSSLQKFLQNTLQRICREEPELAEYCIKYMQEILNEQNENKQDTSSRKFISHYPSFLSLSPDDKVDREKFSLDSESPDEEKPKIVSSPHPKKIHGVFHDSASEMLDSNFPQSSHHDELSSSQFPYIRSFNEDYRSSNLDEQPKPRSRSNSSPPFFSQEQHSNPLDSENMPKKAFSTHSLNLNDNINSQASNSEPGKSDSENIEQNKDNKKTPPQKPLRRTLSRRKTLTKAPSFDDVFPHSSSSHPEFFTQRNKSKSVDEPYHQPLDTFSTRRVSLKPRISVQSYFSNEPTYKPSHFTPSLSPTLLPLENSDGEDENLELPSNLLEQDIIPEDLSKSQTMQSLSHELPVQVNTLQDELSQQPSTSSHISGQGQNNDSLIEIP